jgi:hypothetical protein
VPEPNTAAVPPVIVIPSVPASVKFPGLYADMAVPFPWRTPVIVVDNVIAGVVVGFATVPAKPFAVTTETLVTVPVPAGRSAVTRALKVGCAAAPEVGPANTVFAGSVFNVKEIGKHTSELQSL